MRFIFKIMIFHHYLYLHVYSHLMKKFYFDLLHLTNLFHLKYSIIIEQIKKFYPNSVFFITDFHLNFQKFIN